MEILGTQFSLTLGSLRLRLGVALEEVDDAAPASAEQNARAVEVDGARAWTARSRN
ncbi:MAG TPA: hypothetical protein VNJ51_09445 [Candidatus Dormibacteraeota bacterium]|nr:hypothetical protein [Candidatus Dormibacteraeota bacterium]